MSKKPKRHLTRRRKDHSQGAGSSKKFVCSRRRFLQATGTGLAATSVTSVLTAAPNSGSSNLFRRYLFERFGSWLYRAWSVKAVRKTDLLSLEFTFANLRLTNAGDALELRYTSRPGYIVVTFPSQHILEQAVEETSPISELPDIVQSRLSGPSRLVFKVVSETGEVPYSMEGLLETISGLEMNLNINALARPERRFRTLSVDQEIPSDNSDSSDAFSGFMKILQRARAARAARRAQSGNGFPFDLPQNFPEFIRPRPHRPGMYETALELPYRLVISPNHYGRWVHVAEPYWTHDYGEDRVELWHTRLGVDDGDGGVDEQAAYQRAVRALWTYDFLPNGEHSSSAGNLPHPGATDPFQPDVQASLTPNDRAQIVHLTSNFRDYRNLLIPASTTAQPRAVPVDRLMMSTLGGWLEAHGSWPDNGLGLLEWEHRAAMARDNYVKTVKLGYLFPFGHKTVQVTISERKFHAKGTAYLFKRLFLVILEPNKTYSTTTEIGMKCPFSELTMLTKRTPNLEIPGIADYIPGTGAYWPIYKSDPFRFKLEGKDHNDRTIRFNATAIFVPVSDLFSALDEDGHFGGLEPDDTALNIIQQDYTPTDEGHIHHVWRTSALDGQRVAYAESKKADDTSFKTVDMAFDGHVSTDLSLPYFRPFMDKAGLSVDTIRIMTGDDEPKQFRYTEKYCQDGFDGNEGEVFLETDEEPTLNFDECSDRSGGFMSPNVILTGLSRKMGPVGGDIGDLDGGTFDPTKYLPSAKIFGVIELRDLLTAILDDPGDSLKYAPKFLTQALDQVSDLLLSLNRLNDNLKVVDEALAATPEGTPSVITDAIDALTLLSNASDAASLEGGLGSFFDAVGLLADLEGHEYLQAPSAIEDGLRREILQTIGFVRNLYDAIESISSLLQSFFNGDELPQNMSLSLDWRVPLNEWSKGIIAFVPTDPSCALYLAVEARPGNTGDVSGGMSTLCRLTDFRIEFLDIIKLPFDRLQFSAEPGKKPEIDVIFGGVNFAGALEFIAALTEVIPMDGFSDPPNVDITASGLEANFSLALPDISIGVFSLQNISINAGLEIPFIGDPLSVSFSFCTRENPCTITVYVFGGGGFVGLTLNPGGIELLEMALEFGVALSLDFGVASGSVSAMAGIYIGITLDAAELSGYFRLRGEVDVLGLISASIELYLELSYHTDTGKVIGQASLEIEVEVAFISKTVTIKHKRKFKGSNGDPTFEQVMGPEGGNDPWKEYCTAFVPAA